jgi:hypothetical protein
MPEFLDGLIGQVNQGLRDSGKEVKDFILPDQITFNDQEYFQYPSNLFDPSKHSQMFVIAPYTGEITNKGSEDTQLNKNELAPIFLKIPTTAETSYQHSYTEESLLYNVREISQGGGRSGGLTPNDVSEIAIAGGARNAARALQALPGGDSLRAAAHGGARAAIELLYDAPKLRDFVFSWKFFPDDAQDEQAFIDIYRYLMFLSAPTYGIATQRYPAVFDLQFSSVDFGSGTDGGSLSSTSLNTVMQFTRCAIESITPTFSPGGGALSPSGLPQEIDLTIQFKELMPLDRETIQTQEIGDISGNTTLNNAVSSAINNTRTVNTDSSGLLGGS